jgi:alpha-L-rhamnosidase
LKLAYKLLLNTEYPSWGYLVDHGATTMWERWNGDQMKADPSMNSYNHYAYGAVADWIYRYAAGVDATPLDAGFHTVVLHPVFDARLGNIAFDYASSYGADSFRLEVKGRRRLARHHSGQYDGMAPADRGRGGEVQAGGRIRWLQSKLAKAITRDGQTGYELPAGSYNFQVSIE